MTKCWFKDPEKRLNFNEIYNRLQGDYNYSEEKLPKNSTKKKEEPAYSVPPSLKDAPNNSGTELCIISLP